MTRFQKDRRLAGRYKVKTPLRVRLWKSAVPEQPAESVNLSQRGIYFAIDSLLRQGETVEVLFNMPQEIIGEATSEWRCTGHVVRVESLKGSDGKLGVGVQFDCYEVSKSTPADVATEPGVPQRMMSRTALTRRMTPPWRIKRLSWMMNHPHRNPSSSVQ